MPEASRKTHGRNQPSSDVVAPNSGVQTYGMAPHLGRSQAKACPRPENLDTELAAGPSYRLCSACCDGHCCYNSLPFFVTQRVSIRDLWYSHPANRLECQCQD